MDAVGGGFKVSTLNLEPTGLCGGALGLLSLLMAPAAVHHTCILPTDSQGMQWV